MTHSAAIRTHAEAIFNKIDGALCPIAVFVRNGAVRRTKITSNLFEDGLRRFPHELAGIYNNHCRLEWIADDLAEMGVK